MYEWLPDEEFARRRRERRSIAAKYGHIKRRLRNVEPLTGKILERALDSIGTPNDSFLKDIAHKLNAGQPLDDYELHIFFDMFLLHVKLAKFSEI